MNINPMQLIQMIKYVQNPQQLVMNVLEQNAQSNPILANAANLAHNGDAFALEQLARNLAQQKGLNFDTEFKKLFNI